MELFLKLDIVSLSSFPIELLTFYVFVAVYYLWNPFCLTQNLLFIAFNFTTNYLVNHNSPLPLIFSQFHMVLNRKTSKFYTLYNRIPHTTVSVTYRTSFSALILCHVNTTWRLTTEASDRRYIFSVLSV